MRIRRLSRAVLVGATCAALIPRVMAQDGSGAEAAIRGLRSGNVEVRRQAATTLVGSSKEDQRAALPVFIELLEGEKDGQVRLAILDAVTALGPDAAPAVPALLHTLQTDFGGQSKEELHQDYRSALALAAIGEPSVAALRSLLDTSKVNVRAEAAMALGRIGPAAGAAIPDLIRLLGDQSDRVAGEASLALGKLGADAVDPLLDAAAQPRAQIRVRAIEALGYHPTEGRIRAAILERTRDEVPEVRAAAVKALAGLAPPEDAIRPILESTLADGDEGVRLASVNLLVRRPEMLPRMAPRLKALLTAEDEGVCRHAAFLLLALGPDAAPTLLEALGRDGSHIDPIAAELAQIGRPAVPLLTAALDADEPRLRRGAALALGQLRPRPAGAVEMLTDGLDDPDPGVRAAFLTAIGHLGPRVDAAVPAVRTRLGDESAEIRLQAIDVLLRASPRDGRLVDDLDEAIDDPDPRVQCRALQAIRSLGPLGREGLPSIIGKLGSPHREVRLAAAEVIESHGPGAADAVPALGVLLEDPSPEVRAMAARTLGSIGKAALPALPRLIPLLTDQPVEVRTAAVLALGSVEPEAEGIRPHLAEALRADEPEVRNAALRAIQRLGPEGAIFIPDIIMLAEDEDARRSVERSLRRFERTGPDPRSVPELIEQLGHEQEAVRLLAIKFLGLAGPKAEVALSALERLRDDPSEEVRRQVEEARARITSRQTSADRG